MSGSARWALSPLDCQAHLLVPAGDHPYGVLKARCGHLLPPKGPSQHERPPCSPRRTCPTCREIAQRPTSIPVDRWVSPQDTPAARLVPPPAEHRNVVRAIWGRCPLDGLLHLLSAQAVLQLRAVGSALACCGALLTTQDLTLRARGTPCLTCLVIEAAS